jgi:serine/threonine protein phosphatase PrpC
VLRAYGITDKGGIRPTNEDCFGIDSDLGLCIVADGMGGHNAGEVAARIAVDTVIDYVRHHLRNGGEPQPESSAFSASVPPFVDPSISRDGNLLCTAIHLANAQILEAAVVAREYSGMGTTIVAALMQGQQLSVAHVGDSRLYVFNGARLRQVTDDDSWTANLRARDPEVDPAVLEYHPLRHALTNVVGAHARTEVHVAEETLQGGELIVLTTDGVHEPLDERRMERLLAEGDGTPQMAARLVTSALSRGSRDNCTAIVAQYLPD